MPLHLLVKWEVVSPNSRWGQLESISIISSIPLFWFCISIGGGGGVMFFSHFMLFPTFLEKKSWNTNQLFLIKCFLRVFFVCWKYWKVPLHLQLLVKWEVVSPNSRYRAFYHEIGNIEKCPFTYWLNGGVVQSDPRGTPDKLQQFRFHLYVIV